MKGIAASLLLRFVRNDVIIIVPSIIFMMVLTVSATFAQQLRETQILTSNDIIALAGSGDTLWLATGRGFNYRTSVNAQEGWQGFESNYRFSGMTFGGGGVAAIVNKDGLLDSVGFWNFNHATNRQQSRFFRFSRDVRGEDGNLADPTGSMVFAHGSFWAAFNNGGVVRYDPRNNSVLAIRPGDENEVSPQNLGANAGYGSGSDTRTVLSLGIRPSDNALLITTPAALWAYHPENKTWDMLHDIALSGENFISFDAAFITNRAVEPSTLYSFIRVRSDTAVDTVLYRFGFDDGSDRWFRLSNDRSRFSIYPAVNSTMFTLWVNNEVNRVNEVRVYADTARNTAGPLTEILSSGQFSLMLARAGDGSDPIINDLLFLPRTDSAGMLIVATTTGLYINENVEPLAGRYGDFSHVREVSEVKAGQSYALPGIIRASYDGKYDRCVFVYKLKKDGNVTIRVYDYNMSLVKTVVKGERRRANAERSTDPLRDLWDGTNHSGRRMSPGVYYFKITSTGGERFFGKVVLAK